MSKPHNSARLVKTLPDGTQIYSHGRPEFCDRNRQYVATTYWIWWKDNRLVKERQPTFDELAGHSPATKRLGH